MERPAEGRKPESFNDARTSQSQRGGAAPVEAATGERTASAESGGRPRASMILWLVLAAAVAVGVSLYFIYGRAILPLFGDPQ